MIFPLLDSSLSFEISLSHIGGNEQNLARDTRIKLIAKMMAMDHKNIKTQRFALKTLANLAGDRDVRAYIGVGKRREDVAQSFSFVFSL
jgi:hypothetical protein